MLADAFAVSAFCAGAAAPPFFFWAGTGRFFCCPEGFLVAFDLGLLIGFLQVRRALGGRGRPAYGLHHSVV
ncbi:hypothetical protein GCM10010359_55060 [Streptomyces morookaense]|nr:hypothetical protein GCM10010359_55060 [Streptomyces morookaense]